MRHLILSRVGFTLLCLLGARCPLHAADWPQFRGAQLYGISAEKQLPTTWSHSSGVLWKTDLPGPGTSSPILVGNTIVLTCYTGYNVPGGEKGQPENLRRHVIALDRQSGRILWNTPVAARLPEQESIRDSHGYASSTPAADAERIYCFFGKSGVFAFDHKGKQLWKTEVGDRIHGWGSASSPLLHGNTVYVNASVESDTLYALDARTGRVKWKAGGIKESWSTPVIVTPKGGKPELVIPIQTKLLAFDPDTGAPLWSCNTDISWYMVPTIVAAEGVVYAIGGRSGIAALAVKAGGRGDVTKTHRLWTSTKGSNVSSPVYHAGHLYFANDASGTAFCLNAANGNVVYEERLPRAGQIYASSLLADGKIYYLTRDGKTFVLAAKPSFELIATNDLSDRSLFHATPVADQGRLLIRSDKALYCLGRR